jgi:hypothetical protein
MPLAMTATPSTGVWPAATSEDVPPMLAPMSTTLATFRVRMNRTAPSVSRETRLMTRRPEDVPTPLKSNVSTV